MPFLHTYNLLSYITQTRVGYICHAIYHHSCGSMHTLWRWIILFLKYFYHILYPRFTWHFHTCAFCILIIFTLLSSLALFPPPLIPFFFSACLISCLLLFIYSFVYLLVVWPNEFIYSHLWTRPSFYTLELVLQLEKFNTILDQRLLVCIQILLITSVSSVLSHCPYSSKSILGSCIAFIRLISLVFF